MLETNNGHMTPRFYDDGHKRKKNNKSSPIFKKNLVSLCKEEKPTFISYKPKAKKYFSSYEQINSKKENMQFISDVAQSYKFMENFRNKDLIETAFKIDKDKHINSSQTNDLNLLSSNTANNFQKFYQTISNFKTNKKIPPIINNNLNAIKNNNNINDNNETKNNTNVNRNDNNKAFSRSQNNFLPKYTRMYNKKRINLESKNTNYSSNRNSSQGGNLFATKNNFFVNLRKSPNAREADSDTINISSSDEENNLIVSISKGKKKNKKKSLHDFELKFNCDNAFNYNNYEKTGENFNYNNNNNANCNIYPLEISETETKFFKKYLKYIEFIKKKRLHSPEKKQVIDPNNNNNHNRNSQNMGLTSSNLSPKLLGAQAPNNSNYKEFQPKRNFTKIDISPFDIDMMAFRNAVAKSAEMLMNSIKAGESHNLNGKNKPFRLLDIEKAKKKIFKEIGQNPIFEKLLDKVFRKVIYVSDKNIEICEDYVVNLIHNEIGQLTARNTSIPSDNSNQKFTNGNAKTVNLPPIIKKGTPSSNNSNYALSDNIFGLKGNSQEQKPRSRLDLKGALSPIGEIELDTETKFKAFGDKNFSSKNADENANDIANGFGTGTNEEMGGLAAYAADANGQFYENYKNNFQQQFDAEDKSTKGYNGNNIIIDYRISNFFKRFYNNENKNAAQGQHDFFTSKSLQSSVDYEKFDLFPNELCNENNEKIKKKINETIDEKIDKKGNDANEKKNDILAECSKKIIMNKQIINSELNKFLERKRKDSPTLISIGNYYEYKKNNNEKSDFSSLRNITSQFQMENEERNFLAFELRKSKQNLLIPHKSIIKNTISSNKNALEQNQISKRIRNSDNNTQDDANATLNSDKESLRFIRSNPINQTARDNKDQKTLDNNNNSLLNVNNNISYGVTNFLGSNTSTGFFGNSTSLGASLNAKLNNENTDINNTNNINLNSFTDLSNKNLTGFNPNNISTNAFGFKKSDYASNISLIPEENVPSAPKGSKDAKGKKLAAAGKGTTNNAKISGNAAKKSSAPAKKGKKDAGKPKQKENEAVNNKDDNLNEKEGEENQENFDNNNEENKNTGKIVSKIASSVSLLNPSNKPGSAKKKDSSIKSNVIVMKARHKSQFAVLDSEGNDILDSNKHKRNGSILGKNELENSLRNEGTLGKQNADNKNNFETINFDGELDNFNRDDLNLNDLPKDLSSGINDVNWLLFLFYQIFFYTKNIHKKLIL
jgi:hypothetical protein